MKRESEAGKNFGRNARRTKSSPCFKAFRKSGYCAFHRHKVEGAIPKHLAIRV
jgi:hypothetical protein